MGAINVGVTADLTGLRSGLKQAEAEVKAAAPKIAAAAVIPVVPVGDKSAASSAFRGAGAVGSAASVAGLRAWGNTLKSATAPLRTFMNGIQSFLLIGARFLGWFGLAVSAMQLFKSMADRINAPLRQMQAEIDAVSEKIAKLREEQSKLAAATVTEVMGAPQAEDQLLKLREGVSKARRALEAIDAEIRMREESRKGTPFDPVNEHALNLLAAKRRAALSDLIDLQEKEAQVSERSVRAEQQKKNLAQQRLDIEREIAQTTRRASAQQSAFIERMAADVSRLTALAEIAIRQRVGR